MRANSYVFILIQVGFTWVIRKVRTPGRRDNVVSRPKSGSSFCNENMSSAGFHDAHTYIHLKCYCIYIQDSYHVFWRCYKFYCCRFDFRPSLWISIGFSYWIIGKFFWYWRWQETKVVNVINSITRILSSHGRTKIYLY